MFQKFVPIVNCIYIKACVQNKAQLCASSACISGYVLSDKEQNENINKQLCWINLATVVAGLMKSKLTESQHIDICKPINLLNKKWGDKNPPQAKQLWPHKKKQSSRESWKAKKLLDTCKTMKKIVNTKRDANETAALVWTVTLNVWYKLERWQSIGKFGLKNCQPSSSLFQAPRWWWKVVL